VSVVRIANLVSVVVLVLGATQAAWGHDLTGSWSGDWRSCTSGHKGPLSAQFCRVSPCQYEVRFKGRFFKVIPFRYAVTLDVVEETAEKVILAGSQNLGRIFGTFTYSATVTGDCFEATYTSCKDQGIFRLTRCTAPCVEPCAVVSETPEPAESQVSP
jgi:hypothetical protein